VWLSGRPERLIVFLITFPPTCFRFTQFHYIKYIQGVYKVFLWTWCNNKEVLLRVKEHRNILHEIRKRKASWIGHILRRNCLLQRVSEGKIQGGIEVTGRQGRRRRKLLNDLTERRGYSHLKEEALDRTIWRARFGGGFGPVVRQTTKWMINGGIRNCFYCHLCLGFISSSWQYDVYTKSCFS
jgi:hypothetical protein